MNQECDAATGERFKVCVPSLVELCQQRIIIVLEASGFHGRLVKDLCRFAPDHLLQPIFELLLARGHITDTVLMAYLVPNRTSLRIQHALQVRNSVFKQIGMNCPHLLRLDLSDCHQIRNSVVRSVLQGCSLLEHIVLDRCRRITDAAFDFSHTPFQAASLGCLSLESISLQGCPQITGEIVAMLNKNCRQLTYLNLSQCKQVTSPKIQQVFEHHHLLSLNLAFIDSISDEAFLSLPNFPVSSSDHMYFVNKEHPLQKLNLCKSRITDRSIFRMCSLVALVEIHLQWCTGITDAGIDALVRSCPQLELIDLKSCDSLTDSAVASIAAVSCNLKKLDLSWCLGYTDAGLQSIAAAGSTNSGGDMHLEAIYIEWCPQISDIGMEALGRIQSLQRIHAVGCVSLTNEMCQRLQQQGKNIIS